MRFFRAVVCESKMSTPSSASIRRLAGAAGAAISGVCAGGVATLEAAVAAWFASLEAAVTGSAGAKKLASWS